MKKLLSCQGLFFLIFIACTGLILIALYMQTQLSLSPCPLCITQRIFVIGVGIIALIAGIQNPAKLGRRVYAFLAAISTIIGGGVSARHVWLQNLPEDQVPACGPGLNYMFETLPFIEALNVLFAGDGNCADTVWSFLGLSIPAWTLIAFTGLFVICCYQFFRKNLYHCEGN